MKTTTRTPGSLPTGQTAEKGFRSSWNGSRYREFLLLIAPLLLFSAYPLLRSFEHAGNSGVFGGVRMTGALIALSAGCAFIARFAGPGRRFYLFAGLAFFVAGAEDLAAGFLELAGASLFQAPREAVLRSSIAFRTLTPLLLMAPLVISAGKGVPRRPGRELLPALLSVPLIIALTLYAALNGSPLPFHTLLSRPLDFLSAALFAAALIVYVREFRSSGESIAWWLGLSIGVMLAGQSLLLFSREIYDPFFAAARVCSILGYAASLLGFSLHQLSVEDDQNWTVFRMSAEVDRINAAYLEDVVLEKIREVADSHMATILAMSKLAESRDDETGRHIERTQELCRVLARKMRELPRYASVIDDAFIENIYHAASLHDIGKVGIPDAVLLKEGALSEEEREMIRRHPGIGAATLERVRREHPGNEFLTMGIELTRFHHEKWDGSGYPDGLAGEAIPLCARIMALVDVYDALRSKRPYKDAFSHEQACALINKGTGTHFDPSVAEAFAAAEAEFANVYERLQQRRKHAEKARFVEACAEKRNDDEQRSTSE